MVGLPEGISFQQVEQAFSEIERELDSKAITDWLIQTCLDELGIPHGDWREL